MKDHFVPQRCSQCSNHTFILLFNQREINKDVSVDEALAELRVCDHCGTVLNITRTIDNRKGKDELPDDH